jgi:hypothetical protein
MANELGSNTTENSGKRGKPFTKGDPRINRKGRPKSFDALRELAQEIAHEKAKNSDGKVIVHDGHAVTVAEAIMRKWASSSNPQLQKAFVEIAFGKVPDTVVWDSVISIQEEKHDSLIEAIKGLKDGN